MSSGARGRWRRSALLVVETHATLLAGSAVAVAVALWMTRGAWGGRPPAGDDVMAHLVRADYGLAHIAGQGRLDGWFPRFMLGHQEFLFYGPGFTWLLGGLRLVTFGALSTTGAMKVAAIGGFVAFGPAAAFLARSLGLSEIGAAAAGVLALAVNNVFGVGLASIFVIGLVPQQIAAVLACITIGAGLRTLTDGRSRWPVIGATGLAAIALTHVITVFLVALFGGMAVLALIVTERPRLRAWGRLMVAGGTAVGLAGFWAVPFLAHRDLRGPVTTWSTPPVGQRIQDILQAHILFGPRIGWLVVAGTIPAAILIVRRHRFAWFLLLAPALFLVIAHNAIHVWPKNEIAIQLANRGLGYAGLIGLFPVAGAIAAAAGAAVRLARPARLPHLRPHVASALTLGLALPLSALVVLVLPGSSRSGAQQAGQLGPPVPQMKEAAAELTRVVPAGARFATERNFPQEIEDTGVSHPDFWLARASHRDTLNVFNLESSSVPGVVFTPDAIGQQSPDRTADALQQLGVTHVVTVRPATAATLAGSGRFTTVWQSPPLAVLALDPLPGQPPPASLLSTLRGDAAAAPTGAGPGPDSGTDHGSGPGTDPEHLRLTVDSTVATTASMAVAWSPKWQLRIDGRRRPLHANADGLLTLALPAGHHLLALDYRADPWDRLGIALSALTILGLLGWLGRRVRHYRLRRSSSVSSSRMSSNRSLTA
ncbi:MAG: hypothetical protein QOG64_3303 [Acidimicrobiaceae bacterium]|nr:hypothetical protein [Acidimicrobiaceae bacterium]